MNPHCEFCYRQFSSNYTLQRHYDGFHRKLPACCRENWSDDSTQKRDGESQAPDNFHGKIEKPCVNSIDLKPTLEDRERVCMGKILESKKEIARQLSKLINYYEEDIKQLKLNKNK